VASALSASLIGPVGTLQHLEDYSIVRSGLTSALFNALSCLPRLRPIAALIGKALTPGHILELEVMNTRQLELPEGAFPSLEYLHLPANSRHVRNILEHAHGPRFLAELACDTLHHESPEEIRQLLASIAGTCP
jgi:hypothetical protein